MTIHEISCKSILNKSGISVIDYALNAYTGCEHGCRYCYAVFMKRFSGHKEEWGSFVDVKINAPEVLRKQLKKAKPGLISFSTVTDPYQPLEEKYEITRKCLEALVDYDFSVSILTKSHLVLRDIDLLKELKEVDVGFSVAIMDEKIRIHFEPKSSTTEKRFEALAQLSKEGIETWLFFAPVFPYFSDSTKNIEELFINASRTNVGSILIDTLQLYPKVWSKIQKMLHRFYPEVLPHYKQYLLHKDLYKKELKSKVLKVAREHNIPCDFAF